MKSSSGIPFLKLGVPKKPVIFLLLFSMYIFYGTKISYTISFVARPSNGNESIVCNSHTASSLSQNSSLDTPKGIRGDYLVNNQGCKIMAMDPHHKTVRKFLKKRNQMGSGWRICKLEKQILSVDPKILEKWQVKEANCCYRVIYRVQQDPENHNKYCDSRVTYSNSCIPIPAEGTMLNDSYIKIQCFNVSGETKPKVEFQGVALPPKLLTESTRKKAEYWENRKLEGLTNPPSILVIGVDSTSRLHMMRSLPNTRQFLEQNDFVEMRGYTKVGGNTFPNIMAGFAGMPENSYASCWANTSSKLDDCPYIWKNFSALNYMTGYLEDAPYLGTFNYAKRGFVLPPADYYMRPFMLAVQGKRIGGQSATAFQANFIADFVAKMGRDYPYFLLAWFNYISHDDFNALQTADDAFCDLFSDVVKKNTTTADPDNTIIIFMSDHGYRFGPFRETFLGFYEDNLPFFYFRLPASLQNRYPEWYSNLKRNTDHLTSPHDLYSAFVQILDYTQSHISGEKVTMISKLPPLRNQDRYSLFDKIPDNRTCERAVIPQKYCMCDMFPVTSQTAEILNAELGNIIVSHVNEVLKAERKSGRCMTLLFTKFLYGRELGHGQILDHFNRLINYTDYLVALETSPSKAHFESKIREFENTNAEEASILGDVARINRYGHQSTCISDVKLKPYCFCKKVSSGSSNSHEKKNGKSRNNLRKKIFHKPRYINASAISMNLID